MIAAALLLKRGEAWCDTGLAPDMGAGALGAQMADVPGAAVIGGAVPADVAHAELFRVICLR